MIRSETDGPRILVIRDSYSDSLTPFLSQRFSEVHLFDLRYNRSNVQEYIVENQIDTVLVLYIFQGMFTANKKVSKRSPENKIGTPNYYAEYSFALS